jgi:hypothetical protein
MQYSWIDVKRTLAQEYKVGFDYAAAPVGGHNQHGAVERSIREIRKLFDIVFLCPKYKLDVLSFESAFAYVSNDINNFPICQSPGFKDLAELDILTPNRLLLGRNNRRSLSGPCTVDSKSRMLESLEAVFQTWWGLWNDIRLADFVSKPPKCLRSSPNLEVGDIVVITKDGSDQKLGEVVWTVGRVVEAQPSRVDGKVRQVKIEYKNSSEFQSNKAPTRTTNRAARSVARLAKEGELGLMQELAAAARLSACLEGTGEDDPGPPLVLAVREKIIAYFDASWAWAGQCAFSTEPGSVCSILRIHVDPWN